MKRRRAIAVDMIEPLLCIVHFAKHCLIFFIFVCLIVSGKMFLATNKKKPNTNWLKLYGNVIGRTPLKG